SAPTAVIIPCKDLDPTFPAMLEALACQRHLNYRLYFAVASAQDPAVATIHAFLDAHPELGRLVVTPPRPGYWGKVGNMLGGLQTALADGPAYLVFLDSDTVPAPEFAAHLLRPLVTGHACLSTGARILLPMRQRLPEWVAALWLLASLPGVMWPQQGSAWGGAMALPAESARRLKLERVWYGAFSDDATLSRAVRKAGGTIAFAPPCLVLNPIRYDWSDLLDFLNRQLITIRVHDPRLWYLAWFIVIPSLAPLAAVFLALAGAFLPAVLTILSLLPAVLAFYVANETVWRRLREPRIRLRSLPVPRQIAIFLALTFVHPVAMVRSALTRRFVWRGHAYAVHTGRIHWLGPPQEGA
ncbi:MAG: glycosyltransferase, partial [Caldilineae bacterium]